VRRRMERRLRLHSSRGGLVIGTLREGEQCGGAGFAGAVSSGWRVVVCFFWRCALSKWQYKYLFCRNTDIAGVSSLVTVPVRNQSVTKYHDLFQSRNCNFQDVNIQ
jgi:hypothetical protein